MFCLLNGSCTTITFFWRDRLGKVDMLDPLEALRWLGLMLATRATPEGIWQFFPFPTSHTSWGICETVMENKRKGDTFWRFGETIWFWIKTLDLQEGKASSLSFPSSSAFECRLVCGCCAIPAIGMWLGSAKQRRMLTQHLTLLCSCTNSAILPFQT